MNLGNPTTDQKEAGLMQMRINTRLTALQTALSIMGNAAYSHGIAEPTKYNPDAEPQDTVWVQQPQRVDHITLLAMAGDIEKYIIDDLAGEAKQAIDAAKELAKNPPVRIHRP
jgi:hypothetical protein